MSNTVTLTDNRTGKSYEFPIIDGTLGPSAIDITTLYKQVGMFTYDNGYTSTASCKSDAYKRSEPFGVTACLLHNEPTSYHAQQG